MIGATGLGVGGAECKMHGPADFFVEQNVATKALYAVVGAERHFAKTTRPFIHVDQRVEQFFPLVGRCFDDTPIGKFEANS